MSHEDERVQSLSVALTTARLPRPFDREDLRILSKNAGLSRRALLSSGLALAGLAGAPVVARAFGGLVPIAESPFSLGVASGDPSPDGVVIWTRLAPSPLEIGGGMPAAPVEVQWEVASDERMTRIVQRGRTTAVAAWAHSVHVEVDGLEPDHWYWYRFRAAGDASPIGRTRTIPRPGAGVDRLRFAFCSCQHFEQGLFTAYRHMANEDLDLVFHLGDYIYEGPPNARVRTHLGDELMTLDDYRRRYAQYKADPDLQAAHAARPWILTTDDHEVDNNYAGAHSEHNDPEDAFLARRAAAYRAYYEHMPLRRTSMPQGPWLPLYRRFSYGALASFFVLDTRQYRTPQPCGSTLAEVCDGARADTARLMGPDQEQWLKEGLDRSTSRWNIIPQQVMMAGVDQTPGPSVRVSMDQWPGYEAERTRLLSFFQTRRPANPIVLTGDIHSNWVNDLKVDFRDERSPTVATELVVTSISSGGDGSAISPRIQSVMAENPFVKFYNGQRGYVSCEVSARQMHAAYRVVEFVSKPGAPLTTPARFVVEDGRPGALRV